MSERDTDDLARIQRALLTARDNRARMIRGVLAEAEAQPRQRTLLFISTHLPGRNKNRPELPPLLEGAAGAVARLWPDRLVARRGNDPLGPFQLDLIDGDAEGIKRRAVGLEATLPGGRLLDLDVYRSDGSLLGRADLGLPQRSCFACSQPARECILLRRHDLTSLQEAADSLIGRALEHGSLGYPVS